MNGNDLKKFREKYGLTQEELAEIAGTGLRGVQGWEQNQRKVSQSAIKLMALYEENIKRASGSNAEEQQPPPNTAKKEETNIDYKDKYIALLEKQLLEKENAQEAIALSVLKMVETVETSSKNAAEERRTLVIQNTTILKLVQECLSTVRKKSLDEIVEMTSKIHNDVLQECGH